MNTGALEGIKVADFTWVIAGPLITKNLADYGATVVRIESRKRPDLIRVTMPYRDGKVGLDRAGFFCYYNANKYSLSLDLSHPKGVEVAKRLISWADVVAENFAAGMMEKWGLGYENLKKLKPDIIMLRTSNQGQTGPLAQQPGLGTHLSALAGFVNLTGWSERPPTPLQSAYTDYISQNFATTALVAALEYRRRTGKGQLLDVSQLEAGLQFLTPIILNQVVSNRESSRMGNSCPYAAPHGAYRCKGDDRWCVISVFTDREWEAFGKVIGNPPWTKEPRFTTIRSRKENEAELDRLVEGWTINLSAEEVTAMMQAAGVSAGVVKSPEDIYHDPQLRHRNFFWTLNHKEIGHVSHLGPVSILSKTPAEPRMPAPCLGEHSEFVCKQLLGMSDEEFVGLLRDEVIL
jgi:crotonobetainyl-CoA:carnitine CoA-transferase CaiB-like acyl-CoA transferase